MKRGMIVNVLVWLRLAAGYLHGMVACMQATSCNEGSSPFWWLEQLGMFPASAHETPAVDRQCS